MITIAITDSKNDSCRSFVLAKGDVWEIGRLVEDRLLYLGMGFEECSKCQVYFPVADTEANAQGDPICHHCSA